MKWKAIQLGVVMVVCGLAARAQEWPQWGQNQQHAGVSSAAGQQVRHILEDVIYDPFVEAEKADEFAGGDLLVHYQVPIVDGDDVYMEFKSGQFTDMIHWDTQTWNEQRLHWDHGHLSTRWNFASDWKPVPIGGALTGPFWEPVFHAALSDGVLYVPGAGGSIYKLDKLSGSVVDHIQPFDSQLGDTFTVGPLTVDRFGNVYYQVLRLDHDQPWDVDVVNSWLVKVSRFGNVRKATFASLNPHAPSGTDQCLDIFSDDDLPWPPSPNAVPTTTTCGSQRPPANLAPAVAPDGTIYVATLAHFTDRTSYLLAVNPDLTPRWQASLRDRFTDGCDVLLPASGSPGGCRAGSHRGVDPAQNRPGAGRVIDDSTASPVVAPDGSVILGVYTRYNYAQGHLMKFSASGQYKGAYSFGWDTTPSIFQHGGTYSIILKDNQYSGLGSYCNDDVLCPPDRTATQPSYPEAYFITQLSSNLSREWRWQNSNTLSCTRQQNGQVTCVSDHPNGFEWCVNAAVVDRNGTVYANSEDGNLYVIRQGGTLRENLFLQLALGAAYTPLSMTSDGKTITQNDGHLFVVGN